MIKIRVLKIKTLLQVQKYKINVNKVLLFLIFLLILYQISDFTAYFFKNRFMKEIKLKDKSFRLSMSENDILARVKAVADQINKDYEGRRPLFLSVLNGAFMFTSDLMKEISIDCEISFVKLASYQGTMSTGHVHEVIGVNEDLHGRDIIIVEDIVESGRTMLQMLDSLANRHPASIKVCTLFYKPSKLVEKSVHVDYVAIEIPDDFIVGYGLDYDQLGRNLRDIYTIVPEE